MTTQAFKLRSLKLKRDVTCIEVGRFELGKGETLYLLGKVLEVDVGQLLEENEEGKSRALHTLGMRY